MHRGTRAARVHDTTAAPGSQMEKGRHGPPDGRLRVPVGTPADPPGWFALAAACASKLHARLRSIDLTSFLLPSHSCHGHGTVRVSGGQRSVQRPAALDGMAFAGWDQQDGRTHRIQSWPRQ